MRHLSRLMRLSLPPEMDEMADFHIRDRMVCAVEMPGEKLVNIVVPYGAKILGEPVRGTSASLEHLSHDVQ